MQTDTHELLAIARRYCTVIESLDESTWQRQGRHAFFGLTTMHELLYLIVRHDEIHWQQINKLLTLNSEI